MAGLAVLGGDIAFAEFHHARIGVGDSAARDGVERG